MKLDILKLAAVLGAATLGHRGFNQPIAAALADATSEITPEIIRITRADFPAGALPYENISTAIKETSEGNVEIQGYIRSTTAQTTIQIRQTAPAGIWINTKIPGNIVSLKMKQDAKRENREIKPFFGKDIKIDPTNFNKEGIKTEDPQLVGSFEEAVWTFDYNKDYNFLFIRPTTNHTLYLEYIEIGFIGNDAAAGKLAQEVMTGIGENAEGNCEAVFNQLESHYETLSTAAKAHFQVAYPEAYARYQYLAAFVGKPLNSVNRNPEKYEKEAIAVIAVISLSTLFGYYVFQTKKSKF